MKKAKMEKKAKKKSKRKKIKSINIKPGINWTESDLNSFRYYVGADFVDQLQASFDFLGLTQRNFAQKLSLTESRVSQVFNDPGNLTLDTMIKWGRAAGLKTGVVLYNDGDEKNQRGPLSGSIFVECWKLIGSPIMWPESNQAHLFVGSYSAPIQPTNTETEDPDTVLVKDLKSSTLSFLPRQYFDTSDEETEVY